MVNGADLATADGMPVLYAMRLFHGVDQGARCQERPVAGPVVGSARQEAQVFLYGGRQEVLDAMVERAGREFPGIEVCGAYSPPFAALEEMDLAGDAERINASGAHLVFVSWAARSRKGGWRR